MSQKLIKFYKVAKGKSGRKHIYFFNISFTNVLKKFIRLNQTICKVDQSTKVAWLKTREILLTKAHPFSLFLIYLFLLLTKQFT